MYRAGREELIENCPVSVRCDGANARGKLPVKSEGPGNFKKRLLKMVVHLLMSPGVGEGYRAFEGPY